MEHSSHETLQQALAKARVLEQKLGKSWREHFQHVASPEELAEKCADLGVVLTPHEAQEGFSWLQTSEEELSEEELAQLAGGRAGVK
ncbi:MAG TPA: hypothetical protein P5560_14225 [Thermotogota bacterium]|nr:hypothetical protein [Thermotogota bacterium]HRW94106.1 hypothetical protein [Thermotogota bacterium]